MQELKCPKCGEVFQVDETGYDQIVHQVRDKEFIKEWAIIHGIIDDVLWNIITNKYPIEIAEHIWRIVGIISAPFNKFTTWPIPNVSEVTMIAAFTLSLAIILNKNPLKIISSIKPIFIIVKIWNIISLSELLIFIPLHKLTDTIIKRGIKYRHFLMFVGLVKP